MGKPAHWIDKRTVNAFYTDAKPNFITNSAMGFQGKVGMAMMKKVMKGSWVGGTAFLTDTHVEFHANLANKALHVSKTIAPIEVPISDVTEVIVRDGLITKITDIVTPEITLTIRGYKMPDFAQSIRAQAGLSS